MNPLSRRPARTPTRALLPALLLLMAAGCAHQPLSGPDPTAHSEPIIPIPNGGFENGLAHWEVHEKFWGSGQRSGTGDVSDTVAASGRYALRVHDDHSDQGARIMSQSVRIPEPGLYELRGKAYPVSGKGLGVFVRVNDQTGDFVVRPNRYMRELGGSTRRWQPFSCDAYAPPGSTHLQVWINTWHEVEMYLDDLHFVKAGADSPPWEGRYKIRPSQTNRLTPADVVGPDGIVYPNWTRCGVQDDISAPETILRLRDFGGMPDDGKDDAAPLRRACRAAAQRGGATVTLSEGTYHLDSPVTIRHSGIVIRGRGRTKTRLIFRYSVPEEGVSFFWPEDGARVGPSTPIEVHCRTEGLTEMELTGENGEELLSWRFTGYDPHNRSRFSCRGRDLLKKLGPGRHVLTATAHFERAKTGTATMSVTVDPEHRDRRRKPSTKAVFTFQGSGMKNRTRLAEDARRGDTRIVLEDVEGFAPGDLLLLRAPVTQRWRELTHNKSPSGWVRLYEVKAEAVDGDAIELAQPLRIDFPVVDGSCVYRQEPLRRCGIEDLYLEQLDRLHISGVHFEHALNCWARGVHVKKCGHNPIYLTYAKWCEVRECIFEDSWYNGGGSAYAGASRSWDCLWDGVRGIRMRHAPVLQWGASGNVFRRSRFRGSDIQFHAGWCRENLIEQCTVDASTGHGSYGYGVYATGPTDYSHGPEGPRNVIYNCDVASPAAALQMGGMNEAWIFAYNRFVVDEGPGMYAARASFDHVLRENVFVLRDDKSPMVLLATADCIGIELLGNRLFGGNGRFCEGFAEPARTEDNSALPLPKQLPDRPTPKVPSIYEWQNRENGWDR